MFVHIDYVEDLHFYHYPHDELLAEGKIPLREFHWNYGHMDGELDDDEPPTITYNCRTLSANRRPRDDKDNDWNDRRPRTCDLISRSLAGSMGEEE